MSASLAATRLRRLARSDRVAGTPHQPPHRPGLERCDLCAAVLPVAHRHLLDLRSGTPACACAACSLLFDRREDDGTPYRLVPDRRLRLTGCAIDDMLWARLGIPVDLAFLTSARATAEVTAHYPSPLGTLRATVDPAVWREVTAAHPALPTLTDDTEALLVNRARRAAEYWLLPLDDCYRLAAEVRAHWRGLGGGAEVWHRIDDFFHRLSAE